MSGSGRGGGRWNRRAVVQWAALIAALQQRAAFPAAAAAQGDPSREAEAAGYGRDPPLNPPEGSRWPRVLETREREAAHWLLDEVLPADEGLPAASELGLVDFLAEWLSAPYRQHQSDRALIRPLLCTCAGELQQGPESAARWLQTVSERAAAGTGGRPETAADAHAAAFARLRLLAAAAYYTTAPGITAIGFVGNEPRERFDGPPEAVLQRFDAALRALGA